MLRVPHVGDLAVPNEERLDARHDRLGAVVRRQREFVGPGGDRALRDEVDRPEREQAERLEEPADACCVGVRLTMTGLEPNEAGSRYECWWVGRNGKVSAGSFRVGPDGVVDVRLNVAGSLDGPVRINVNKVIATSETTVLTADVA